MTNPPLFNFKSNLENVPVPDALNNPFSASVPTIAQIAAQEFQQFIVTEAKKWQYDFHTQKGKMLGVLVVQSSRGTYHYLGAVSGKLPNNSRCARLAPSLFDDAVDDFFINKGMAELAEWSQQIRVSTDPAQVVLLKEKRKQRSVALQRQLFQHYNFLNLSRRVENILTIFARFSNTAPPSAAGECAAPKLLQCAIQHQLKPIALAEFWWGKTSKNGDKKSGIFYPACEEKCRPILEYMLEDTDLFLESRK